MNNGLMRTVARYAPLLAALAETGSVTAAADEVGIPQSSASRSLQRVSALLGAPVTQRQGRTVTLTPVGEAVCRGAAEAMASIRLGLVAAGNELEIASARLSIAFQTQLGERFLPAVIGRYHGQRPGVSFDLVHGSRASCIEAVLKGTADLGLLADPPPMDGYLVTELFVEPLVAVVSTRHPLAGRETVDTRELAAFPLVMLSAGYGLHDAVKSLMGESTRPAFEVDDYRVARGLAIAGLGVTVLPRSLHRLDDGATEIPIDSPAAHRRIGALTRAHPSVVVSEFLMALTAAHSQ